MEFLIFGLAVCLIVGLAMWVSRRRKRAAETMEFSTRRGGGTR